MVTLQNFMTAIKALVFDVSFLSVLPRGVFDAKNKLWRLIQVKENVGEMTLKQGVNYKHYHRQISLSVCDVITQ